MKHASMILMCLLGALTFQSAAADQVLVKREVEPMPERGEDVVRKIVNVRMPGTELRYRELGPKDGGKAIVEQYGDHFLGLYFGRPPRSNGGWNAWRFLRVRVRQGDRTFIGDQHMMLDNVYVLERHERRMILMRWPLPPAQGEATSSDDAPHLDVTLVQYPSMSDWLFLRVAVEGEGVEIDSVRLSCYPGNTSGPEERQRWVAAGEQRLNMHEGAQTVSPQAPGLVFFNRFAQQQAGCLLVPAPNQAEAIKASGTYAINADFTAAPERRVMTFALGYFRNEDPAEASRRFFAERQPTVAAFMDNIDWQARFSWSRVSELVEDTDGFMADETDESWIDQWRDLKARLNTARQREAVTDAIDVSDDMRDFKQRLLEHRLNQYR